MLLLIKINKNFLNLIKPLVSILVLVDVAFDQYQAWMKEWCTFVSILVLVDVAFDPLVGDSGVMDLLEFQSLF